MRTPPVAAAPSDSILVRIVRGVLLLGLSLLLSLLLGLGLLAQFPPLRVAITPLFHWSGTVEPTAGWLTLGFIVGTPVLLLMAARRLRLRSWWWIGGGYLAIAPVLAYLAHDDGDVLHAETLEAFSPRFPGAETSYAVLMQYSKQTPSEEAKVFETQTLRVAAQPTGPDQVTEWIHFLQANRADLEADWADLAPQRRWMAELNAFERIGDLGTDRADANIISFRVWRLLSKHTVAQAGLQALDGHGDAAIETLLPLLQLSRKLQPASRTLVRNMIALVTEKLSLNAAIFVLDHAEVSSAARARLAATLEGGTHGADGARRLIGVEYSMQRGIFLREPLGHLLAKGGPGLGGSLLRSGLNLVGPFVYNPVRTVNLVGQVNFAQQELAATRQLRRENVTEAAWAEMTAPRFKNFCGALLVAGFTPAYHKVVESYWNIQDLRDTLAARL